MLTLTKKIKLVIFLVILSICTSYSLAIVKPTTEFYVNDYANIISKEVEEHIISKNTELEANTGAQIVVVTVPNLEGRTLEEYSNELFREFGIGSKEQNSGLLLLLALEERQFRVEVGYGLEGILPDGKTGRIQDEYIIPYLKENNWNEGIKSGFDAYLNTINSEYEYIKPPRVISLTTVLFDFLAIVATFVVAIVMRVKEVPNRLKKSIIYLIASSILLVLLNGFESYVILIWNFIIYIFVSLATVDNCISSTNDYGRYSNRREYPRSSSRSSYSDGSSRSYSRHNRGGGGSAGGGGSSRGF